MPDRSALDHSAAGWLQYLLRFGDIDRVAPEESNKFTGLGRPARPRYRRLDETSTRCADVPGKCPRVVRWRGPCRDDQMSANSPGEVFGPATEHKIGHLRIDQHHHHRGGAPKNVINGCREFRSSVYEWGCALGGAVPHQQRCSCSGKVESYRLPHDPQSKKTSHQSQLIDPP